MSPLIKAMNEILAQWKNVNDFLNLVSFEFTSDRGFLCFKTGSNICPLCQESLDLKITSAGFDAETIQFFFEGNKSISISIDWPEDEPPIVTSAAFIYILADPGNSLNYLSLE